MTPPHRGARPWPAARPRPARGPSVGTCSGDGQAACGPKRRARAGTGWPGACGCSTPGIPASDLGEPAAGVLPPAAFFITAPKPAADGKSGSQMARAPGPQAGHVVLDRPLQALAPLPREGQLDRRPCAAASPRSSPGSRPATTGLKKSGGPTRTGAPPLHVDLTLVFLVGDVDPGVTQRARARSTRPRSATRARTSPGSRPAASSRRRVGLRRVRPHQSGRGHGGTARRGGRPRRRPTWRAVAAGTGSRDEGSQAPHHACAPPGHRQLAHRVTTAPSFSRAALDLCAGARAHPVGHDGPLMSAAAPGVSVCIVTGRRLALLDACLASIEAQVDAAALRGPGVLRRRPRGRRRRHRPASRGPGVPRATGRCPGRPATSWSTRPGATCSSSSTTTPRSSPDLLARLAGLADEPSRGWASSEGPTTPRPAAAASSSCRARRWPRSSARARCVGATAPTPPGRPTSASSSCATSPCAAPAWCPSPATSCAPRRTPCSSEMSRQRGGHVLRPRPGRLPRAPARRLRGFAQQMHKYGRGRGQLTRREPPDRCARPTWCRRLCWSTPLVAPAVAAGRRHPAALLPLVGYAAAVVAVGGVDRPDAAPRPRRSPSRPRCSSCSTSATAPACCAGSLGRSSTPPDEPRVLAWIDDRPPDHGHDRRAGPVTPDRRPSPTGSGRPTGRRNRLGWRRRGADALGAAGRRPRPSPRGRCSGVIGGNGSGKTTLLQVLAGVIHPTARRVDGARAASPSLVDLSAGFHRDLTGHENLLIGGVLLGLSRAEVRDRARRDRRLQRPRPPTPSTGRSPPTRRAWACASGSPSSSTPTPTCCWSTRCWPWATTRSSASASTGSSAAGRRAAPSCSCPTTWRLVRDHCDEVAVLDAGRVGRLGDAGRRHRPPPGRAPPPLEPGPGDRRPLRRLAAGAGAPAGARRATDAAVDRDARAGLGPARARDRTGSCCWTLVERQLRLRSKRSVMGVALADPVAAVPAGPLHVRVRLGVRRPGRRTTASTSSPGCCRGRSSSRRCNDSLQSISFEPDLVRRAPFPYQFLPLARVVGDGASRSSCCSSGFVAVLAAVGDRPCELALLPAARAPGRSRWSCWWPRWRCCWR